MSVGLDVDLFRDIPGYKGILKAVLKSQIQLLVHQLSENTGEESVLLSANVGEGTISHLGSESGKHFLQDNNDVKRMFLGYCLKRHQTNKSQFMAPDRSNSRPIRTNPQSPTISGRKMPYFKKKTRRPSLHKKSIAGGGLFLAAGLPKFTQFRPKNSGVKMIELTSNVNMENTAVKAETDDAEQHTNSGLIQTNRDLEQDNKYEYLLSSGSHAQNSTMILQPSTINSLKQQGTSLIKPGTSLLKNSTLNLLKNSSSGAATSLLKSSTSLLQPKLETSATVAAAAATQPSNANTNKRKSLMPIRRLREPEPPNATVQPQPQSQSQPVFPGQATTISGVVDQDFVVKEEEEEGGLMKGGVIGGEAQTQNNQESLYTGLTSGAASLWNEERLYNLSANEGSPSVGIDGVSTSELQNLNEGSPPGMDSSDVTGVGGKNYMKTPQIDGLLVSRGEGRYEKLIRCDTCGKVCRTSNMARHRRRYCTGIPGVAPKRRGRPLLPANSMRLGGEDIEGLGSLVGLNPEDADSLGNIKLEAEDGTLIYEHFVGKTYQSGKGAELDAQEAELDEMSDSGEGGASVKGEESRGGTEERDFDSMVVIKQEPMSYEDEQQNDSDVKLKFS